MIIDHRAMFSAHVDVQRVPRNILLPFGDIFYDGVIGF